MPAHASSVRTRPWVDDRRINSGRSTRVTVRSNKRTDPTRRTLSTRAKAPFPMGWMTSKSSNPIALVCLLACAPWSHTAAAAAVCRIQSTLHLALGAYAMWVGRGELAAGGHSGLGLRKGVRCLSKVWAEEV